MNQNEINSVVVIGAGPVGLSAAAHLLARNIQPIVIEKGSAVGSAISQWGHIRVFSPWKYVIDQQLRVILENTGWQAPDPDGLPTGHDIVEQYLQPAASTPELAKVIKLQTEVIAVSKHAHAKSFSKERNQALFSVHIKHSDGTTEVILTQAVIDASGTWSNPNPIGLDGLPVPGEIMNKDAIRYGLPDVVGRDKNDYASKRVLVLGGGHSAINIALELLKLQKLHPETKVVWGLRTNQLDKLLGGGINDELPARQALGNAAKNAVNNDQLELLAPFAIEKITRTSSGLAISATVAGQVQFIEVDRIIVAAGFRPDLNILRELRLDLDSIVEAPAALAPLIDPNLHSCGTVPPHGYRELAHPDEHFFIVGMKAYGRAPTFLMLTGYEQVRSIAAKLAGDNEAAARVELVLPNTGVCCSERNDSDCCRSNTIADEKSCCG
ncbi:NAD(P)-binding domain-containing protein [Pseudoalteromonas luteoviolacea]|uniref:Putative flavoprotein n=1 Tax=Pseudoalteromonas luteoviolacea (strain 2ta16) TaxID=1353533 RepID=V4JGV0_PSEL2|nr:NAD(P)-binding domain-containing protein [Pseudoalteromonas luteoviolacea]ESP94182.1 putative flavoprotein [Pseudoalteromonas luteoviolacea 2ta16]KZN38826.1 hypothetical protein N483_00215 [Pseudoalteromonas luteoviolacea NCIMB 1944]